MCFLNVNGQLNKVGRILLLDFARHPHSKTVLFKAYNLFRSGHRDEKFFSRLSSKVASDFFGGDLCRRKRYTVAARTTRIISDPTKPSDTETALNVLSQDRAIKILEL